MSARTLKLMSFALITLVLISCNITTPSAFNRKNITGSGDTKTEERSVSGFDKVSLEGIGKVILVQGSEEKLTVEAEENLLEYITTEVSGSTLKIGYKQGYNLLPRKEIRYNLTLKDLTSLSVAGAHDVETKSLKSDDLTLSVSGAGKLDLSGLDVQKLHVNATGAGNFILAGATTEQDVLISGAGSYNAADLKSTKATITVTGAGNSTVWVTSDLSVQLNGFGKVDYYGSPKVSKQINGAGSIESKGDK